MSEILQSECERAHLRGQRLRGVLHAYSEDASTYRRLKECGDWLFGIGGVVTYKKSIVAEAVAEMALEDIILETDCPYLTPVPYRGRRNESAYVGYVCQKIAQIKGLNDEEVARVTTANARRMFLDK
jgi:TatD DNase family protein